MESAVNATTAQWEAKAAEAQTAAESERARVRAEGEASTAVAVRGREAAEAAHAGLVARQEGAMAAVRKEAADRSAQVRHCCCCC